MSKSRESGKPAGPLSRPTPSRPTDAAQTLAESLYSSAPRLSPRPKLMIIMAIALVAFFVVLVGMYAKTVYPYRDKPQSVEIDQPASRTDK